MYNVKCRNEIFCVVESFTLCYEIQEVTSPVSVSSQLPLTLLWYWGIFYFEKREGYKLY